jgi:hypothetical protein
MSSDQIRKAGYAQFLKHRTGYGIEALKVTSAGLPKATKRVLQVAHVRMRAWRLRSGMGRLPPLRHGDRRQDAG